MIKICYKCDKEFKPELGRSQKRCFPCTKEAIGQSYKEQATKPRGGKEPVKRKCLQCYKTFVANGRFQRLCPAHRQGS